MIRTLRRTAATLAIALTAVVATTLGAAPAQADDNPILPLLHLLVPPRSTPTPTPTPPKHAASPAKPASAKPAKHATTHKKRRTKHTASPARPETTTVSSVVLAPTTSYSASSSARSRAHRVEQVAAPDFAATTPVRPVPASQEPAPTAAAELVSSHPSTGALSLWVPTGLVGMLAVLMAGALWSRRRNGSF